MPSARALSRNVEGLGKPPKPMGTRILLADSEVLLREALVSHLEGHDFTVVGEASDGPEAVALVRKLQPDVAVLELVMSRMSGLQAAREIGRVCPSVGVILLTISVDARHVVEALQSGVLGVALKTQPIEELVHAIREVHHGRTYVTPGALKAAKQAEPAAGTLSSGHLSLREREVLSLVAEGKTTKQVAEVLSISRKTVDFHRSRMMRKLNIHETATLVRYAIHHGLIAP